MLTSYNDIKQDIKAHWEQLEGNPYAEDVINELAESAVPIYYGEIIREWQEMPHEYNDTWCAEHYSGNTIYSLMTYDLAAYYNNQYHTVYNELCEEMETTNV